MAEYQFWVVIFNYSDDISIISSQDHLESDCYNLFKILIKKCRKWFIDPEKGGLDSTSELEYYIRDIYHNQLKTLDIELYRHLERNHILPQVWRCIIKWGAFSRWSSFLYCPMLHSDQMTIRKTHPLYSTLIWGSLF